MAEEQKPQSAADAFGATRQLGSHTIARWRMAEFGDYEQWIKMRRAADARRILAKARDLEPEQRERLVIELATRPVSLGDMLAEMRSRTGLREAVRLALRQHQPHITDEEVEAVEFEAGGMVPMLRWFAGLPPVSPPAADGESPPDPPAADLSTSPPLPPS